MANTINIINNRLDEAIRNLEKTNFEELFPLILEDLEYMLTGFEDDCKKLSSGEKFKNKRTFENKKNTYFSKLVEKYFKLVFNEDVNIINTDDINFSACAAGYNWNDGNIYYSYIGSVLTKTSGLTFLHTCLHEGRHKMQHSTFKETNPLSFPPCMLKALKESLLEKRLCGNNREFYSDNYYQFFVENDAEYFAKCKINEFLDDLLQYIKLNKNYKMKWTLLPKIKRLKKIIKVMLCNEPFEIDESIIGQLYTNDMVTGEYVFEEQNYDKIIITDKYIKSHPELQNQYPILRLLFNGTSPKNYEQIKQERIVVKTNLNPDEQKKIDELYNEIVKLDPILMISNLLEKGDMQAVREYIDLHPSILDEYPTEIEELTKKYGRLGGDTK